MRYSADGSDFRAGVCLTKALGAVSMVVRTRAFSRLDIGSSEFEPSSEQHKVKRFVVADPPPPEFPILVHSIHQCIRIGG
jgi:hypothetical protein